MDEKDLRKNWANVHVAKSSELTSDRRLANCDRTHSCKCYTSNPDTSKAASTIYQSKHFIHKIYIYIYKYAPHLQCPVSIFLPAFVSLVWLLLLLCGRPLKGPQESLYGLNLDLPQMLKQTRRSTHKQSVQIIVAHWCQTHSPRSSILNWFGSHVISSSNVQRLWSVLRLHCTHEKCMHDSTR